MLRYIEKQATPVDLAESAKDLEQYIKFVVDIEENFMTIGGTRHFEGEQLLLKKGSNQRNLWGEDTIRLQTQLILKQSLTFALMIITQARKFFLPRYVIRYFQF